MSDQKMAAFPDTNSLLHFRSLNEIDWCEILQVPAVEIKIAPIVTRELEQQKVLNQSRKLRERAATALTLLHSYLGQNRVRDGVTLDFLIDEPASEIAAARGLNLQLGDDRLIGTLLLYRDQHSDVPCVLVTNDLPLTVKATHYQIRFAALSEGLRLTSEPDPLEKRNRQLEAELQRYKSRHPVLRVQFENGENHVHFRIHRQSGPTFDSEESEIQSKLAAAKQKCPLIDLKQHQNADAVPPDANNPLAQMAAQMAETIRNATAGLQEFGRRFSEDYNDRATKYHRDYEKYLRDAAAFETLKTRTVRLDLEIENAGTCPAEDIHLDLHFPDGFMLYDEEHPPKEPKEPEAPSREPNLFPSVPFVSGLPDIHLPLPRNPNLPRIRKTNSYEVTFETEKLQHGFLWTLTPLYVAFDSWESANSFSIEYFIHAGNMLDQQAGELGVVVQKVVGRNIDSAT